jgi:hypothetical protein
MFAYHAKLSWRLALPNRPFRRRRGTGRCGASASQLRKNRFSGVTIGCQIIDAAITFVTLISTEKMHVLKRRVSLKSSCFALFAMLYAIIPAHAAGQYEF